MYIEIPIYSLDSDGHVQLYLVEQHHYFNTEHLVEISPFKNEETNEYETCFYTTDGRCHYSPMTNDQIFDMLKHIHYHYDNRTI